ncbi:TPA: hypothetical protein QIB97_003102 [Proteus mirabilis]|nr:hypothetical protein [Proteus mirabilis]
MSQYVRLLSDISLMAGLIGYFEYNIERHEIADWLEDTSGRIPELRRVKNNENHEPFSEDCSEENRIDDGQSRAADEYGADVPPWLELLMINQWMFCTTKLGHFSEGILFILNGGQITVGSMKPF